MSAIYSFGKFDVWLASPWECAVYRCASGPFRWFAFLGPLCVWRRR